MTSIASPSRSLSTFGLLMIAIISVDSIRNLPISAQYGLPLVFFYIIAGVMFFIPLIIVTADFATAHPNTGGSYLWIKEAFGPHCAFSSIWLQWVYNVIWYPTIFAFISTTIAGMFYPALETNQHFILICSLILFWLVTFISSFGIRAVSWLSVLCAILGTLLPMCFIVVLAAIWLWHGHPSAIVISWHALLPTQNTMVNLAFFANILFSLLGLDVVAIHAGDVKEPHKTYVRALSIAGFAILLSLILSSLALCIVLPPEKIGLLNGLMDVFNLFFSQYHLSWGVPVIGAAIVLGSLGIASSWIIGLARGFQVASSFSSLPKFLQKLNRYHMPHGVLLLQGGVFTVLVAAFLLFPDINNAYWILSSMTSQFALLYYVLMFSAAFKLYRQDQGLCWKLCLPIMAIIISIVGISVGFVPPSDVVHTGHVLRYELLLCLGAVAFFIPLGFLLRRADIG